MATNGLMIVMRDERIGDALMALPAVCALAKKYKHEKVYYTMANDAVRKIADFPDYMIDVLHDEPRFSFREMVVQTFGAAAAINYHFHPDMLNIIQCHFNYAGLPIPAEVPRPLLKIPDINAPEEVEYKFDVLLAPWASDPTRGLTIEETKTFINELNCKGLTVGVIGAATDPIAWHEREAVCIYGTSLDYVVRTMRRAKCVITVDSAGGRLAHAADITNKHIILATNVTPLQCQVYPGVQYVLGEPGKWNTHFFNLANVAYVCANTDPKAFVKYLTRVQ